MQMSPLAVQNIWRPACSISCRKFIEYTAIGTGAGIFGGGKGAGIGSVIGGVGGLGTTAFHGHQKITLSSGQEMLIRAVEVKSWSGLANEHRATSLKPDRFNTVISPILSARGNAFWHTKAAQLANLALPCERKGRVYVEERQKAVDRRLPACPTLSAEQAFALTTRLGIGIQI